MGPGGGWRREVCGEGATEAVQWLRRAGCRRKSLSIRRAWGLVAIAGLTSIGLMAAINFMIDSDFKWFLLLVAGLWALALALYLVEKPAFRAAPPSSTAP